MELLINNEFESISSNEMICIEGGTVKDAYQAGAGVILISTAPAVGVGVGIVAGPAVGAGVAIGMVGLGCAAIANVNHRIHNK